MQGWSLQHAADWISVVDITKNKVQLLINYIGYLIAHSARALLRSNILFWIFDFFYQNHKTGDNRITIYPFFIVIQANSL